MKKNDEKVDNSFHKALFFFLFYGVFFVLIFLIFPIRGEQNIKMVDEYELGSAFPFSFDSIQSSNYSYTYVVTIDGFKYVYNGKRNQNMEFIQFQNQEYFRIDDQYYLHNNSWVEVENPIFYSSFLNCDVIRDLLNLAYYKSQTLFEEDNSFSYRYILSTNALHQYFFRTNSDFIEEGNPFIVEADSSNIISSISLDLTEYGLYHELCSNQLKIELQYFDFGHVEQFENPII